MPRVQRRQDQAGAGDADDQVQRQIAREAGRGRQRVAAEGAQTRRQVVAVCAQEAQLVGLLAFLADLARPDALFDLADRIGASRDLLVMDAGRQPGADVAACPRRSRGSRSGAGSRAARAPAPRRAKRSRCGCRRPRARGRSACHEDSPFATSRRAASACARRSSASSLERLPLLAVRAGRRGRVRRDVVPGSGRRRLRQAAARPAPARDRWPGAMSSSSQGRARAPLSNRAEYRLPLLRVRDASALARIERVAQAVAEQVERQHQQEDRRRPARSPSRARCRRSSWRC